MDRLYRSRPAAAEGSMTAPKIVIFRRERLPHVTASQPTSCHVCRAARTDIAPRRIRCIKSPALHRLEVERLLSRRHEALFEFERVPLVRRHQYCLSGCWRERGHGRRIKSTRAVVRLAYSPQARPHIPGPSLRRPPTAAPRLRRGKTIGDCVRQRLGRAFVGLRQAAHCAPLGRQPPGSRRRRL